MITNREPLESELNTITSKSIVGDNTYYYQSDEPIINNVIVYTLNWLGLEQQLRYSALFAKAFTDSTEKGFSLFMVTLVNGKNGQASESSLAFAFSVIGVTWTDSEKIELNTILSNNNFTITV